MHPLRLNDAVGVSDATLLLMVAFLQIHIRAIVCRFLANLPQLLS